METKQVSSGKAVAVKKKHMTAQHVMVECTDMWDLILSILQVVMVI